MFAKLLIRARLVILLILGFVEGFYSTNSSRLLNQDSAPTAYCSFQLELIRFVGFHSNAQLQGKACFLFNFSVLVVCNGVDIVDDEDVDDGDDGDDVSKNKNSSTF